VSDETGRSEVYVQAFPGPARSWRISLDGGATPAWAPDGRQLFFRRGMTMMAADVSTNTEFVAHRPRPLFDGNGGLDVARDGRFLMTRGDPQPSVIELELVQNWFEELKARVPAK
jgi:hypothetical protein